MILGLNTDHPDYWGCSEEISDFKAARRELWAEGRALAAKAMAYPDCCPEADSLWNQADEIAEELTTHYEQDPIDASHFVD